MHRRCARRSRGLPRLDILVNNAGGNFPEPFVDVSDDHLDKLLALNLRGAFVTAQAAVRKMLEAGDRKERGGSVINISSQMGHVGAPRRTVYCMTKHGIEGLTKAMAVELAPHEHPRQQRGADLHRDADDGGLPQGARLPRLGDGPHPARPRGPAARCRRRHTLSRLAGRAHDHRHQPRSSTAAGPRSRLVPIYRVVVPPPRIELGTSALPRMRSTTELRRPRKRRGK